MMDNGHISSYGLKEIIIFFSNILFISASIVKAKSFISDFAFFIWNQKIGSSLLLKEENYRLDVSIII